MTAPPLKATGSASSVPPFFAASVVLPFAAVAILIPIRPARPEKIEPVRNAIEPQGIPQSVRVAINIANKTTNTLIQVYCLLRNVIEPSLIADERSFISSFSTGIDKTFLAK